MEERLTDLEIKVAYLERLLGELDAVVRTTSEEVGLLQREVARLRTASDAESELPPIEKPPHY